VEKQSKLIISILKILYNAGVLDNALLIGSWCAGFYKKYFGDIDYNPIIKTRDIDFLVGEKSRFPRTVDLEKLLAPLGFEIEFYGKGFMKLESDELAIEFLVPEVGRPKEKPHPLPQLHFNAQPLRHLSILWRDPITVNIEGIKVRLPNPADFCLQKLIVAGKRKRSGKAEKDMQTAFNVLEAIVKRKRISDFNAALRGLSSKERNTVVSMIQKSEFSSILKENEVE